jgi:preprotein translocase subunit SecA
MLLEKAKDNYRLRKQNYEPEAFNEMLKSILLFTIDNRWREHLYSLDALREGISLRAYAQKDPLVEYKQESFKMFDELLRDIARDVAGIVFRASPKPVPRKPVVTQEIKPAFESRGEEQRVSTTPRVIAKTQKVGRNDPCPCGSGKKYKKCCGRNVV